MDCSAHEKHTWGVNAELPNNLNPEYVAPVLDAVDDLRGVIDGLYDRIRDGNVVPPITCGTVVDDVGAAVDSYLAATEALRNNMDEQSRAVLVPFHLSVAADIGPFVTFETVNPETPAIGITFQVELPRTAEALTELRSPADPDVAINLETFEDRPPADQHLPDDVLYHQVNNLVDTIAARATRSTARVLTGGVGAAIGVAQILAAPFPALDQQVGQIAEHIRHLLSEAFDFVSNHLGQWPNEILDFIQELDPFDHLADAIVGAPINALLGTGRVRAHLATANLIAIGVDAAFIHQLDRANKRRVEWPGRAAPLLHWLHAVPLGVVPASLVAAAVLLAWILLVSADHLGAPVVWRLHHFPGLPGTPR